MLKLFAYLVHGCWHEWKILEKIRIFEKGRRRPVAIRYHLQCIKCGVVRGQRIS